MGQDSVLVVEVDKSDPKAGLDTVQDKKDMETTPKLGLDYDEHNKDKGVIGSDPIVGLESKSNWLDEDRKLTDRVFEDISNMGFNCSPKIIESKEEFGASKHALPLSAIQSERENVELVLVGVEEEDCSDSSEEDVNFCNAERVFFPEFEQKKDLKRRFGSLMRFQDKVISSTDRKKRDRALQREKKNLKEGNDSVLSGKSLTDSDLVAHSKILIKRARETLKLGKSVGIRIEGNEEEAIGDLARLESL
ncbi:hypothetical protein V6N13_099665 [Hibiscus sabdariffa]